jgi:hypothetical protein
MSEVLTLAADFIERMANPGWAQPALHATTASTAST